MGYNFLESLGLTNKTSLDLGAYVGKGPDYVSATFCECGFFHILETTKNNLKDSCPHCSRTLLWKNITKGQVLAKCRSFRKSMASTLALRILKNEKRENTRPPRPLLCQEEVALSKLAPFFTESIRSATFCHQNLILTVTTTEGKKLSFKAPIQGLSNMKNLYLTDPQIDSLEVE